jgi:uncharacterized protein with HEPN domain
MRPEEGDAARVWDIGKAIREVRGFTAGVDYQQFLSNREKMLAVERALEIIGEAAGRLSEAFRSAHPEIPWRSITGLRNVLAHAYGEVNPAVIWAIATTGLDGPEALTPRQE